MPSIYTSLCKLLDIEVPIISAPISNAANSSLVAAVSNAGGLGTFAMFHRTPEGIRELIEEAHRLTGRPFCANFILRPNDPIDERLQACLDAGINVVQFFWEEPNQFVDQVHESGALVMYTVPSAEAARAAVDAGVDIIVAQGWEAGGHVQGDVATMALVPRVVDAVPSTPVVAAGGIADGRGLAAALALGAAGVVMGTRFLASEEAIASGTHGRLHDGALRQDAEQTGLAKTGARLLGQDHDGRPASPIRWRRG
ncbi:MAG: nitronate monooxygenase, partial [Chloroflexi bacterium]|nr:nitronate monooxygenase [Chloroflexota bacterium]